MSVPGKATVTASGYRAYIQSAQWRATRQRYWKSKLPKECWVCDAPRTAGMHLHHRTYNNLGNERLMDLVPVCPGCHEVVHEIARCEYGGQTKNLWTATTKARRLYNSGFGSNSTKKRLATVRVKRMVDALFVVE